MVPSIYILNVILGFYFIASLIVRNYSDCYLTHPYNQVVSRKVAALSQALAATTHHTPQSVSDSEVLSNVIKCVQKVCIMFVMSHLSSVDTRAASAISIWSLVY